MKTHYKLQFLFFVIAIALPCGAQQPVKLTDTGKTVILSNEYVRVTINKQRAFISSLIYKNLEMIGKQHVNWNIVGSDEDESRMRNFPPKADYSIRINPQNNAGERAEVTFKYTFNGDTTTNPIDMDIRFSLGRTDKGVYLSAVIRHRAGYPAFNIGQGRMIVELNPAVFDFYTVDSNRQRKMATGFDVKNGLRRNVKEANLLTTGIRKGEVEHKYDYAAILAQTPTWGWTSTEKHVGVWMINPSTEYMNGGPTQVGITGHVECILLNHWHDGHYGGGEISFTENENWEKFIGPIFLYCNASDNQPQMWNDAKNEATKQRALWPFSWVNDKQYPQKMERATLSGQIQVNDPAPFDVEFSDMWVGLACTSDSSSKEINWQYEGKNYQFWVKADKSGNFVIPNIRSGKYSLYAFANGILGEYKKPDIAISAGSTINLGTLVWTPVRYGKQLWGIGIPDRSAAEFRHGNHYWQWGLYMLYPEEFPNDVNFTIGKSDWSNDWNYCQPTVIGEDYKVIRGTTWTISFDLPQQVTGKATLRLAICGSRNCETIKVGVNGVNVGNTGHLPHMGVMHRDGIRGKEIEIDIPFDAKLLKSGTNKITLSLNARNWTFGVLYDYLRLELDETSKMQISQ
jgi:rhamnogalacturonan endolyase